MPRARSGRANGGLSARRTLLRRTNWTLAQLRAGKPIKATLLARDLEVSVRTVYRDLDYMRDEMRVPLEFDRSRQTFYLAEPAALFTPMTMSRGELVAILFAERVLRQYRGTPFEKDLESAIRKIQELMPEEVTVSPDLLDPMLSLDLGPTYAVEPEIFASVLRAYSDKRAIVIRYLSQHRGATGDRRIHPYHVYNHRGDWYVAAWDGKRREVRDFALHRIRRVVETTESYQIPGDFDRRRYLADAFAIEKGKRPFTVAIRFSPRQARWIRERKWHRTARVEELIDGGCVLRFRATGPGEIKRWVMQFGAEAEVMAPAGLRKQVAADAAEMARKYGARSVV
jgi:predicted DNA-binding transcriptional regulator YafY